MMQRSVLDSWIGLSEDSNHKRLRQTMLDGWVLPNNAIQLNEQQLHSPIIPLPLNLDIDAEHDNTAVDLLMPGLTSDSDDASISSDHPVLAITSPPSDGYLWNLVPPVNYQYLDSSIIHTTDSSRSNSSDGNHSDDSFVCDEDVVYTDADVLTLTKMFPKTAQLLQIVSVQTPGLRSALRTD
jgi:hypothetical protein